VALGGLITAAGIDVPSAEGDAMRRLGRHYIPARYPDAHASGPAAAHYGAADAVEAIRDAEQILAFVDASWRGVS